jgi:hypothetical protein
MQLARHRWLGVDTDEEREWCGEEEESKEDVFLYAVAEKEKECDWDVRHFDGSSIVPEILHLGNWT